jgi:hypothetical protein
MQRKWLKMSPARPWAQIYIDVIDGDAWRGLSINARRILDALILLHFENKQAENGKLQISYTQFADVGVRRKSIAAALRELEGARMIVKGKGVATTNLPVRPLLYGLPMYFVAATGGIVNAGSRRFAWVPLDILESGAWRGLSINARRMMDRLLIENARHMGEKNGSLRVSFLQFERYRHRPPIYCAGGRRTRRGRIDRNYEGEGGAARGSRQTCIVSPSWARSTALPHGKRRPIKFFRWGRIVYRPKGRIIHWPKGRIVYWRPTQPKGQIV